MNKHNVDKTDKSKDKKNPRLERSREKEKEKTEEKNFKPFTIKIPKNENNLNLFDKYKKFKDKLVYNIPIKDCIDRYDDCNYNILKYNSQNFHKIKQDFKMNIDITPEYEQETYKKQMIDIIKKMKKSNILKELPSLPFGKALSDQEFISFLKECVDYANYHLNQENIEKIKNKLLQDHINALENLFSKGKIFKDIIQNALITILTTDDEKAQKDNFDLLNTKFLTATPLIKLEFNNDDAYKIDMSELIQIYSSHVYITNFLKTFEDFNIKKKDVSENKLKYHIKQYFNNHYIFFCDLPQKIMVATIHTANIYLKANYLEEYFNNKDKESQIIIREKIILNIGHELAHILLRLINIKMNENFLLKSNNKNSKHKKAIIQFKDKFTQDLHELDLNESGNILDFNMFNKYYFGEIFPEESDFFLNIKNYTSISVYYSELDKIIQKEKNQNLIPQQVNKFKKLNEEPIRWCIRSRIFRTVKINQSDN